MGAGGGGILSPITGALFGRTKKPEVPELPEAPGETDPEVEAAKKKERKLARLRGGRQSTVLTNLRKELSPPSQAGGDQLG